MSRHHLGGVYVILSNATFCLTAVVAANGGEVKQTGRHLRSTIRPRFTAAGGGSPLITVLFGQWGVQSGSVTFVFT